MALGSSLLRFGGTIKMALQIDESAKLSKVSRRSISFLPVISLLLLVAGGLLYTSLVEAAAVFVQQNYATPANASTTVNVTYTGAQTAGNTNILMIGWNNQTANI